MHNTGNPIIWKEGERDRERRKKNEHKEKQPEQAKQVALVTLGSRLVILEPNISLIFTTQSTI